MREDRLQWAWYKGLISGVDEYSRSPIELIHPGVWNLNEPGPDFKNAIIRIGTITWCGDVEIHVLASDWYKHKHHHDSNYDNVILHVVVENDYPLSFKEELIPTIVVDAFLISNLTSLNKKDSKNLTCRFDYFTFSKNYIYQFWRMRMERKHREYSYEKEITAFILKKSYTLNLRKRNARQRELSSFEASLRQLRNEINFQTTNPLGSELRILKNALSEKLTSFECNSILINGVIPSLWNPKHESELYAFANTIPAEKNKIIAEFNHILPLAKNAYETQALLEINHQLCRKNNCLSCEIGRKILGS